MDGWSAVLDHERLAVGVRRWWRVTGLDLSWDGVTRDILYDGVTLEQWRQLLHGLNLADTLTELSLKFAGRIVDVSSTNPPIISTLTKLTYLWLGSPCVSVVCVSGSLSFVQNLTQLQELHLINTQLSGSISFRTTCERTGTQRILASLAADSEVAKSFIVYTSIAALTAL